MVSSSSLTGSDESVTAAAAEAASSSWIATGESNEVGVSSAEINSGSRLNETGSSDGDSRDDSGRVSNKSLGLSATGLARMVSRPSRELVFIGTLTSIVPPTPGLRELESSTDAPHGAPGPMTHFQSNPRPGSQWWYSPGPPAHLPPCGCCADQDAWP